MRKLIQGIIDFRRKVLPEYRETFARLALGQAPDSLFVACSDSRVVPNLFASTNPGDLFVLRNVGNLIPPIEGPGLTAGDGSPAAAIEFSVIALNVRDIVVCGHSECGAMRAILSGTTPERAVHLKSWLRYGEPALERLKRGEIVAPGLSPHDQLSQLNVLQQVEHLMTYPVVREAVEEGRLQLHGWWFDIKNADVHFYDPAVDRFVLIHERAGELLGHLQI